MTPGAGVDQFEHLKTLYLDSLREKRARLDQLWARIDRGEADEETITELRRCLHHLAGSSGAYGFENLGHTARQLERPWVDWMASDARSRSPATIWARRLGPQQRELRAALEDAISACLRAA